MKTEENSQLRSYKKIGALLREELEKGIYKLGDRLSPLSKASDHNRAF